LENFSVLYPEIMDELKQIIDLRIHNDTPPFKSRAKILSYKRKI